MVRLSEVGKKWKEEKSGKNINIYKFIFKITVFLNFFNN